jgi:hypothetical protein
MFFLLSLSLNLFDVRRYMSYNIELTQLDNSKQVEYRRKFHMVKQSLVSIGFSIDVCAHSIDNNSTMNNKIFVFRMFKRYLRSYRQFFILAMSHSRLTDRTMAFE